MDEALGQAVIDFSGRPYAVITTNWSSPMVGGINTTLIEHFFQSFSVTSASNVHLISHYGKDNHHMAESLFKAFARAASSAVQIDPRRKGQIPSSKGVL
jgi:imidazoleglycerol-phosphate dehydratase